MSEVPTIYVLGANSPIVRLTKYTVTVATGRVRTIECDCVRYFESGYVGFYHVSRELSEKRGTGGDIWMELREFMKVLEIAPKETQ